MTKKLQDKTEEWKRLESKAAEEYCEKELMPLIVQEFIHNDKEKRKEKVEYMIFSVGTSYGPQVLNISLFQPENFFFFYNAIVTTKPDRFWSGLNAVRTIPGKNRRTCSTQLVLNGMMPVCRGFICQNSKSAKKHLEVH